VTVPGSGGSSAGGSAVRLRAATAGSSNVPGGGSAPFRSATVFGELGGRALAPSAWGAVFGSGERPGAAASSEVGGGGGNPSAAARGRLQHHGVELGGDAGARLRGRRHRARERPCRAAGPVFCREERPPSQQLVHHHPEREAVAACVERLAQQLLGRHVPGSAL